MIDAGRICELDLQFAQRTLQPPAESAVDLRIPMDKQLRHRPPTANRDHLTREAEEHKVVRLT